MPVSEIVEKGDDRSINRYKQVTHEEVVDEPPKVFLASLRAQAAEISRDRDELEAML